MYVFIVFDRQNKKAKDVFLTKILAENYIKNHFDSITKYADVIENRLCDECEMEDVLKDNAKNLDLAKRHKLNYILIEDEYHLDIL